MKANKTKLAKRNSINIVDNRQLLSKITNPGASDTLTPNSSSDFTLSVLSTSPTHSKKNNSINMKPGHKKSLFADSKISKMDLLNSGENSINLATIKRKSNLIESENTAQIKVVGRFRPFNEIEKVIF